ncbi:polymorphic toxin-type HINT domain-containing protein, partial [Cytophagaceae bacterium DM2B3-1]
MKDIIWLVVTLLLAITPAYATNPELKGVDPVLSGNSKEELIKQTVKKIVEAETRNRANFKTKNISRNQYIIELDPNWIEERGERTTKFLESNYEAIASQLREFNNPRSDSLRFYVVVVNDWKLRLDERLRLDSLPVTLDFNELGKIAAKQSEDQKKRVAAEMSSVPSQIKNALTDKGFTEIVIYFAGLLDVEEFRNENLSSQLYQYTSLLASGKRFDVETINENGAKVKVNEVAVRNAAHASISGTTDKRVQQAVLNIINAIQNLDKNYKDPAIACYDTYQDLYTKTASYRTQEAILNDVKKTTTLFDNAQANSWSTNSSYQYLVMDKPEELESADDFVRFELSDKLKVLENNSTRRLFVVFQELSYMLSPEEVNSFAEKVASQSKFYKPQDILVVVAYVRSLCVNYEKPGFFGPLCKSAARTQVGIYCQEGNLVEQMAAGFRASGSWSDRFNQAYSKIPKKHIVLKYAISYYLLVKQYATEVSDDYVSGYDKVYDLQILVDDRLRKYIEAQAAYHRALRQRFPNENRMTEALTALEAIPSLPGTSSLLRHGLKESALAKFKNDQRGTYSEVSDQFVRWFIAGKHVEADPLLRVSNWLDQSTNSPADIAFLKGVNPIVLESYYTMLDAAGMALNFAELDWITDGLGFLVAGYYQDTENQMMYGVSLVIPVGSLVVRSVGKGTKRIRKTLQGLELVDDAWLNGKWVVSSMSLALGGVTKDTYKGTKVWLESLSGKLKVYHSEGIFSLAYLDNTNVEREIAKVTSEGEIVATKIINDPEEVLSAVPDGRIYPPDSQEPIDGFGLTRDRNGNLGCSGGFCFVASTPVWVSESGQSRPIGDLHVGETVVAQHVSSSETALQKIVSISRNQVSRLVRVIVGSDTIWSTVTHPFVSADGKTIPAGNLRKGIWLRKAVVSVILASSAVFVPEDQAVAVDSVAIVDTSATVYNLKVEHFDAYLVGQQGMVVSTICPVLQDLQTQ